MEAQLQARVGQKTEAAFNALAARLGLVPGELLRQVVMRVLAAKGAPSAPGSNGDSGPLQGRVKALVAIDVKAAWSKRALDHGMTASELLRNAIGAVLASNPPGDDPLPDDRPSDREPTGKVTLTLLRHELAAIDAAAAKLGWKRNTWIVGVLRTALFNEPRTTAAELNALHQSSRELLAIGRNLNQLAHAMHRDDRYKDSVTVQKLDLLRGQITSHVDRAQALLDAAEHRWDPAGSFRPETEQGH